MNVEELPEGWAWSTVGAVSNAIQYGYTASAVHGPAGPRFLRITDIQGGKVDWTQVPTCEIVESEFPKYELREGDIVFARTGATTGKSYLLRECPKAIFASYLIRLRPGRAVLPGFLSVFFNTSMYWDLISVNVSGNAQPNCNASKLASLQMPLPPLAEQRRIVSAIERILAQVNAARERLNRVPATLKRFRQAVLAAACSGRLTADWRRSHPTEEWEDTTLEQVVVEKPRNGFSPRAVDRETPVKSLTLTATTSGTFKPGCFKYLDIELPSDSYLWLHPGDILIQRSNTIEYVGVSAVYNAKPKEYIYPDLMMKVRAKEGVDPIFLWCSLSEETARNYLRSNATGTAGSMPKINQGIVCATPIRLPPLAEQQEIVRRVSALFALADRIEAKLATARQRVDALTQAVLAKAFRGELVPTEAELARREDREYEPASVLLERIRASREQQAERPLRSRKSK